LTRTVRHVEYPPRPIYPFLERKRIRKELYTIFYRRGQEELGTGRT